MDIQMVKNQGLPIPLGNIMIYDYNGGLPMKIKKNIPLYAKFVSESFSNHQ
jgi:hypothetical protein